MLEELENTAITVSKGDKSNMEPLKRGDVCIGWGQYKGEKVHIWLKKIPGLEMIEKKI